MTVTARNFQCNYLPKFGISAGLKIKVTNYQLREDQEQKEEAHVDSESTTDELVAGSVPGALSTGVIVLG